jgi:hypothetical protein
VVLRRLDASNILQQPHYCSPMFAAGADHLQLAPVSLVLAFTDVPMLPTGQHLLLQWLSSQQ